MPLDLPIIKHNAQQVVAKCDEIQSLLEELDWANNTENTFYKKWPEHKPRDIQKIEKQIREQEVILMGMLK